jgi:Sulfotransferase family
MYLYIMGRGRSGSTILDILLGNSGQIESVGELLFGLSRADHAPCSCGASMSECSFWRRVRSRLEGEGITWDEACGMLDRGAGGLWRIWRAGQTDPAVMRKALITKALARAIGRTAGRPHLVDSGKSPTQGLLLLWHLPEARVIHLLRDPRAMLQSYVWRVRSRSNLSPSQLQISARRAPLFLASTAMEWTVVNLLCDLMAKAFASRVLRVRFEDLCAEPAVELERIGRAFGLDLRDLADLAQKATSREPLAVGHNIGGNHLRYSETVRFDPGGGRRELALPRWLAVVNLLLCGPLMWRYGYRLGSGGA